MWLNKIHENVIRTTATTVTTTTTITTKTIITTMDYGNKRANKCVQFTVKYTYAGITSCLVRERETEIENVSGNSFKQYNTSTTEKSFINVPFCYYFLL